MGTLADRDAQSISRSPSSWPQARLGILIPVHVKLRVCSGECLWKRNQRCWGFWVRKKKKKRKAGPSYPQKTVNSALNTHWAALESHCYFLEPRAVTSDYIPMAGGPGSAHKLLKAASGVWKRQVESIPMKYAGSLDLGKRFRSKLSHMPC